MNFKWAYCAFTLALVVAACGEKKEAPTAVTDPAAAALAAAQAAPGLAAVEAMGVSQGGAANAGPMKSYMNAWGRVGDELAKVTDEASAKAAATEIEKIAATMTDEAKKLEALTEEEKRAAVMASATEAMMMTQKVGAATATLAMSKPELLDILSPALEKVPSFN